MAKLVTKFKYIKSGNNAGTYLKYVATRDGVQKIDDSKKDLPVTENQKELIAKILRDFPDTKEMPEYDDYTEKMSIGAASELISRSLEDNASEMMNVKTYADYIATRPRAERFGSHGLFTDDGVAIKLSAVSEELNAYTGNVWTGIISLRREDASRLGFDNATRWRDMLRTQTETLSEVLRIPMGNLRWYAAFHNESHHPHVHLLAYSVKSNEGFLTKKGVNKLRSSLAKDIFEQDLISVYDKQTEQRDTLKAESKELIAEIISKINGGVYDNPVLEEKLTELAERLSATGGKKVYGYLKADVKSLVDSIVDEVAKDSRISALYDLWYEQKEEILLTYSQHLPKRIPLSQNNEFKSVRNTVIAEAMNVVIGNITAEDLPDEEIPVPEPTDDESDGIPTPPVSETDRLRKRAESGKLWDQYALAKLLLDRESEQYDPSEAVRWLISAAQQNLSVAKYRLGKLFLQGKDIEKNIPLALYWLEESVKEENQYAEYLLGKVYLKGEDADADIDRAAELLTASADKGSKYAAYTLGKAYLDGTVLPKDTDKAIEYLTQSADKGFAPAQYVLGGLIYSGEIVPKDIRKALDYLLRSAGQKNPYAAYLAGKILLTEETHKNVGEAVRCFHVAAEQGNSYAEFMLGKLYLYGRDAERDEEQAMMWLNASAQHGNPYAAQMLRSIQNNRNYYMGMAAFRLLAHISRIIKDRLEDEQKGNGAITDRKLMRKIEEKKQAHGLRMGG